MRSLAPALVLIAFNSGAASSAPIGEKGNGPLTPSLEALADPAVAHRPPAAQAEVLGLPTGGPGSLVHRGERVLVTARFGAGVVAAFESLREAGAQVVSAARRTQTATLAVAPEDLPAVAAVPGVKAVWQVREPLVFGPEDPCEGGSTISEGVAQLRVDEAREAFGLRGKGITVGVLSDSYDTAKTKPSPPVTDAQEDEVSDDLPGPASSCSGQQLPVNVLDEGPVGGDEGRAMLQIVHDLAPNASLAFATAFESEEGFAQNIERLARPVADGGAGAQVIVDDVAWFEEPFFQDGPVAVAINKVTAAGATYLSATGNDNLFDSSGNEIASWEAPAFRDSNACPTAISSLSGFNGTHCMDFNPGAGTDRTFGLVVAPHEVLTIDLQWAEPWNGVDTDLDAFLLDSAGSLIAWSVDENNGGTGTERPVEIVQWVNETSSSATVHLAINRYLGVNPRLKFILLQNGGGVTASEYPKSSGSDVVGPAIYGHAGAASSISVAAVPYNDSTRIEPFSSRGPVTHYFEPVDGIVPSEPLSTPEDVPKPDLAATDCGATTFFAFLSAGTWRFCGTSAAAPHAAAVAALVRQAKPTLPAQQVRDTLTETAVPVGSFPARAAGAGLVDAFAAIGSLPGPIEGGDEPGEEVPPIESPDPGPDVQAAEPAPVTMPPEETIPPAAPAPAPQAPETLVLRRPAKVVRARAAAPRLVFRFGSDSPNATFVCRIDGSAFRPCSSRLVHRFARGRHLLKVKARGPSGHLDPTPAVVRFRVVPR